MSSDEGTPPDRQRRHRHYWIVALVLLVGVLVAIAAGLFFLLRTTKVEPPPRATDRIEAPRHVSAIAVPLDVNVSVLSQALERAIPRTLWSIDQHIDKCVPPARVRLFKKSLKVTPALGCTVVGTVTRAPLRLHGEGEDIIADMPIHARISARDVGGVLKGETATGSAMVHARIRLTMHENWTPAATVRLAYAWTDPPGIDFLGRRITFADKADERLQPIVRELERTLPREIAKLDIRGKVAGAWHQAFTSLALNEENPPVWMRITPQRLSYGGYRLSGTKLQLNLGIAALTETFVGARPEDPTPIPLRPLSREKGGEKLQFFIPVIADYAELEPVILRALTKRAQRPFRLPGIGPVAARFEKVEVWGTDGGRIAVGLTLAARPEGRSTETQGVVWVTARPVNAPNSQQVHFEELSVAGDTNGIGGDILVRLAQSSAVSEILAGSLTQNFTHDFQKLLGKVERAIVEKRAGDFVIRADIGEVRTGVLRATGQGLYLPVWADGSARVEFRPH